MINPEINWGIQNLILNTKCITVLIMVVESLSQDIGSIVWLILAWDQGNLLEKIIIIDLFIPKIESNNVQLLDDDKDINWKCQW